MGKNRNILLLVILLGAVSIWFVVNNRKSTIDSEASNFAINDTAFVDKIVLQDHRDTIVLEKNLNNGKWKLNGLYKVYTPVMARLLYTMNKLSIKTPVSKKEHDVTLKKLKEEGIKCAVYQKNELMKSYYVGEGTEDRMGTYMVLVDNESGEPYEQPFITHVPGYNSYLSPHYNTDADYWRDKTLFNYDEDDIQSITVQTPQKPEKDYELYISPGPYRMVLAAGNKTIDHIDNSAVKQYLTYFFQLYYDQVDKQTTAKSLQGQSPVCVISVKDINGKINKVVFYIENDSSSSDGQTMTVSNTPVYLKALLDNGEIARVKLHLAGKLFQEPDYFIPAKD